MKKEDSTVKQNENSTKKSTHVLKQSSPRKGVRTVPYKRAQMLQRRMIALTNEKSSWEEKNKELLDALNAEKLLNASLKKESFHWKRLYHESAITINTYKVKQFEMAQALSTCLREMDSIYPNMVAFTNSITSIKINLTDLLNNLPSSDYSCLAQRFNEGGGGINNENRKTDKRMKHKVGPMVKGLQIVTKPKILLERLMLPETQDQIINGDEIFPVEETPLSPIPEEDENPCLRHVSIKLKRSKLGKSWRQRRQEKLQTDVARERDRTTSVLVPFNGDSSDSECIPPVIQNMEEPAVRFNEVNRLTKISTKVQSSRGKDAEAASHPCGVNTSPDDPMEGSSWMYNNYYRPSHTKECQPSSYKSDSSDEEDALVVQKITPNLSSMNTLVIQNQSPNSSTSNKTVSKPKDSTHNTSSDRTHEEPDSTNNDVSLNNNNISIMGSKSSSYLSSASSPGMSTDYGTSNNTIEQRASKSHSRLSVCLSKVPSSTPNFSSSCSNRYSDLYDSLEQSCVTTRKRIRKPANHRYPSEDYILPRGKSKSAELSIGEISLPENKKNEDVKRPKKRTSSRPTNMIEETRNDCFENEEVNKDSSEDRSSKTKDRSSKTKDRNSKTKNRNSKTKGSKSKTRFTKKGIGSLSPSLENREDLQDRESEGRPRRHRSNICYKESPLSKKLRRP